MHVVLKTVYTYADKVYIVLSFIAQLTIHDAKHSNLYTLMTILLFLNFILVSILAGLFS